MNFGPKSHVAGLQLAFLLLSLLIVASALSSLRSWLEISAIGERASDYWVVPILSFLLFIQRRSSIFADSRFTPAALVLVIAGLGINAASTRTCDVSAALLGVVIAIIGAFVACFGTQACQRAIFPLALLLLAIPLPLVAWRQAVEWLQHGSAAVLQFILVLLHVSFHRADLQFQFSNLTVEIAPECSGIRSSYALLVITLLLSYLWVHSFWRRALLVAAVIPLVLIKNGIRIATISLLAEKVDPAFIDSPLHHRGGFVFFSLVLALEGAFCWLLRRGEIQAGR